MSKWFVAVFVALLSGASAAHGAYTFYYSGSPGSYISAGKTRTMSSTAGAAFSSYRNQSPGNNAVAFSVSDSVDNWNITFEGSDGTLAVVGDYQNAQRYPFQDAGHPGLAFSGDFRGNNSLTGNFQVLQADFDSSGNVISYAANFVQYDGGNTSAQNTGFLRYNSNIPLPEPSSLTAVAAVGMLARRRRP